MKLKLMVVITSILLLASVTFTHADTMPLKLGPGGWFRPILNMKGSYFIDGVPSDMEFDLEGRVPDNPIEFDLTVGAAVFGFLFAEAQIVTTNGLYDTAPANGMFDVYQSDYGFRAGVERWGLRVGWEHWCYHPVLVMGSDWLQKYGGADRVFLDFSLNRLYVSQGWKLIQPLSLIAPEFEVGVSYTMNENYLLWDRNTNDYFYSEAEEVVRIRSMVGVTMINFIWMQAEINIETLAPLVGTGTGPLEYVQVPSFVDFTYRAGIELGGLRIGYENMYYLNEEVYNRPWQETVKVFIEVDLDRILISGERVKRLD